MYQYGLTIAAYRALLESQNGRCAICGAKQGEKLKIDHDHRTGKVRGLLCGSCNVGIAAVEKHPVAAYEYLRKHELW